MRQVNTLEPLADLDQHASLNQIDGSKMRLNQFEVVSR
jgi:hypothetical protein